MEVLDSFQRANENPLSDGGKWSRLFTTGTEPTGKIAEEAWNQITSGNLEGAYWKLLTCMQPGMLGYGSHSGRATS